PRRCRRPSQARRQPAPALRKPQPVRRRARRRPGGPARSARAPSFPAVNPVSYNMSLSSGFGERARVRIVDRTGDQPRAPGEGEVVPRPMQDDGQPAPEADEEENMREAPDQPGRETGEPQAPNIGDRATTNDGRKMHEVAVAERHDHPA